MYTYVMYGIMLGVMLLTCRTSFSVVQWIFMPTLLISTTITLPCGRCTKSFDHHSLYDVSYMYDKFRSSTVNVQAATIILNNPRANLVRYVHT